MATVSLKATLKITDPSLTFLLSRAALDLDSCLQGRVRSTEALDELSSILREFSRASNVDGGEGEPLDPPTINLLASAHRSAFHASTLSSVDELLQESGKIADMISPCRNNTSTEQLRQARDFCLALTSSLLANRKAQRDSRPSHPFRR